MAKRKTSTKPPMTETKADAFDAAKNQATAKLAAIELENLANLGDRLAKEHRYQSLCGIDAIRHLLMTKHNWLPSQVRSMSHEDLLFATAEWQ